MRCIHCNRPMKEPTVTIKARSGPLYWGPKCARMAGLLAPRRPERKAKQARATEHTDQLDWINVLANPPKVGLSEGLGPNMENRDEL